MPDAAPDDFDDADEAPEPSRGGLFSVFRKSPDGTPKPSFNERLTEAMLKPPSGGKKTEAEIVEDADSVEALEALEQRADDKERLIGLLAAPLAGMIGLLVTGALISNDPKQYLANGTVNLRHVDPKYYVAIGLLSVVLAGVILAMAWFRKRLYLGIALALYGLSIFNLHYWGFGVPFILAGSWYLVRAYRIHNKLKLARAGDLPVTGSTSTSKRYTPPAASAKPKPRNTRRAG